MSSALSWKTNVMLVLGAILLWKENSGRVDQDLIAKVGQLKSNLVKFPLLWACFVACAMLIICSAVFNFAVVKLLHQNRPLCSDVSSMCDCLDCLCSTSYSSVCVRCPINRQCPGNSQCSRQCCAPPKKNK